MEVVAFGRPLLVDTDAVRYDLQLLEQPRELVLCDRLIVFAVLGPRSPLNFGERLGQLGRRYPVCRFNLVCLSLGENFPDVPEQKLEQKQCRRIS